MDIIKKRIYDERTVDLLAAGVYELLLDNTGLAIGFISSIGELKKSMVV